MNTTTTDDRWSITYVKQVHSPAHLAGEPGDVRELWPSDAMQLVSGGYAIYTNRPASPPIELKGSDDDS